MAMRNPIGRANYQPNSFGKGRAKARNAAFARLRMLKEAPRYVFGLRALPITIVRSVSSLTVRQRRSRAISRWRLRPS